MSLLSSDLPRGKAKLGPLRAAEDDRAGWHLSAVRGLCHAFTALSRPDSIGPSAESAKRPTMDGHGAGTRSEQETY
jgi:hypothetical protein